MVTFSAHGAVGSPCAQRGIGLAERGKRAYIHATLDKARMLGHKRRFIAVPAFKNAQPPSGSASSSSAFASAMLSRVFRYSKWDVPTMDTTPKLGFAMAARCAIWPGRSMPISTTSIWVDAGAVSTV